MSLLWAKGRAHKICYSISGAQHPAYRLNRYCSGAREYYARVLCEPSLRRRHRRVRSLHLLSVASQHSVGTIRPQKHRHTRIYHSLGSGRILRAAHLTGSILCQFGGMCAPLRLRAHELLVGEQSLGDLSRALVVSGRSEHEIKIISRARRSYGCGLPSVLSGS